MRIAALKFAILVLQEASKALIQLKLYLEVNALSKKILKWKVNQAKMMHLLHSANQQNLIIKINKYEPQRKSRL